MARKTRILRKHVRGTSESAYPSSPQRPPTINLWIMFGDMHTHMQVHTFCARYAAWKSLQIALNGREYGDADDMGWQHTEDGEMKFRLSGDVDGLLDEEFDTEWMPPQPYLNELLRVAGKAEIQHKRDPDENEERPNRVRKPRVPGAAPVSRDGLVSLAEICEQLNIEPRDARKTLRNKVEKPDAGWAWPAAEAAKVKAILKK
jgi:hypothetical protein